MSEILIGKGEQQVFLLPKYGNRHGLVAGATGTVKTVSLLVLAEGFSRLGVPVFMADVKGDVAGLAMAGTPNEKIQERVAQIGIEGYSQEASPVVFWDLLGKAGHPVRTTISEMGPALLGRILELNEIQAGTLKIAFKLADDQGLLLLVSRATTRLLEVAGELQATAGGGRHFEAALASIALTSVGDRSAWLRVGFGVLAQAGQGDDVTASGQSSAEREGTELVPGFARDRSRHSCELPSEPESSVVVCWTARFPAAV